MQLAVMSAKSKRMKTRHTAALALVGWYLTTPMNLTGPGPWMAICWAQQGFQPFSPQSHPSSEQRPRVAARSEADFALGNDEASYSSTIWRLAIC